MKSPGAPPAERRFSARMAALEPSITLELDARAKEYAQRGRDIVNMSVGEPDFPAPRVARAAAIAKIESGRVAYTQAAGAPELRGAIARHLAATRGTPFSAAEIAVCHSAKHALSGTLLALVQEGDEVLIPLPAWGSYFEQVKVCGAQPVLVPPAAGCRPDLAALARAVTPRTRAVLLNSPCNPTGYVWTEAETRALAELACEHDLWIVSDEIYRALVYEGPPAVSPVSCGADARARTAIVDGASKCFAMTGYRIGFVAAPPELAAAVGRLHSQLTGSPNAVSQAAYQAALESEPEELEAMRAEFAERRRVLLEGLARLGLETPEPRGAFYAFPDVSRYLDERGSVGLCEDLLERAGLSLVPGEAFGMPTHVRLSYAKPVRDVREALRRLGAFLERRG